MVLMYIGTAMRISTRQNTGTGTSSENMQVNELCAEGICAGALEITCNKQIPTYIQI